MNVIPVYIIRLVSNVIVVVVMSGQFLEYIFVFVDLCSVVFFPFFLESVPNEYEIKRERYIYIGETTISYTLVSIAHKGLKMKAFEDNSTF